MNKSNYTWTVKEGCLCNTEVYTFPNGLYCLVNKNLNRAYVYNREGRNVQEPIDLNGLTVQQWEEILLGIEKL